MKKPGRQFTDEELVAGAFAAWIVGLIIAIVVCAARGLL